MTDDDCQINQNMFYKLKTVIFYIKFLSRLLLLRNCGIFTSFMYFCVNRNLPTTMTLYQLVFEIKETNEAGQFTYRVSRTFSWF